jgi:hypothetical protein
VSRAGQTDFIKRSYFIHTEGLNGVRKGILGLIGIKYFKEAL